MSDDIDRPADTMKINGVEYHRTLKQPVRDGRCNRCLCPAQAGRAFCSPRCETDWMLNTNQTSGDSMDNAILREIIEGMNPEERPTRWPGDGRCQYCPADAMLGGWLCEEHYRENWAMQSWPGRIK